MIILSFDDEMEYVLPAAEVAKIEQSYTQGRQNGLNEITTSEVAIHETREEVSDTKVFGFWVYLMTDLVIFAVAFCLLYRFAREYFWWTFC